MTPAPVPEPVSSLPGAIPAPEYIYAVPVTPKLYGSDAHPGEPPPPDRFALSPPLRKKGRKSFQIF
jgi:hypothetical protein